MQKVSLRQVGGSVVLTVPPAMLEALHLAAGTKVGLTIHDGKLVVEPKPRNRYSMADLLAASDYAHPQAAEEREWVDASPAGREPL